MATVLETFFARLGFEVDEGGLQNAQAKIAGVGKSILGLGLLSGLSVAGILKLTTATAEALGGVERLSQRTGLATDTIAGMSKAAAGFGVSSDATQSSLENLNRALGGIVTGTAPRMKAVFQAIGLSARDAAGQQKDVVTFLGDVAERIRGMSSGAQQQILTRLGIDPNMITMLRNGREEFLQLYETARQGVLFRPEDYKQAEDFQRMFTRVRGIMTTIGQNIGLEIMRPMMGMLDRINKWWASNGKRMMEEMRGRLKGWGESFAVLGKVFDQFAGKGDTIVRVIEYLGVVLGILVAVKVAQWVTGIITAFGPWGAALLLIAGLIYLIIDDFLAWKSGGKSVIGYFEKNFPEAFAMIRNTVTLVGGAFKQLWTTMKQLWETIKPYMPTLIKGLVMVAAVILGAVLGAFSDMLRLALWVINGIIQGIIKLPKAWQKATAFMRSVWEAFSGSFMSTVNDWKNLFQGAMDDLRAIWTALREFFKPEFDALSQLWTLMTNAISGAWTGATAKIKAAWQDLMGRLTPWLERIERFFGVFKSQSQDFSKSGEAMEAAANAQTSSQGLFAKAKGAFTKALDWMPTMQAPPLLTGALAGVLPSTSIMNAQRTATTTNQTDVKATINVTAPSPEQAAEMTADKVNDLARLDTRNAQTGHF